MAVRVVCLVAEDAQVGERRDGLEPEVSDLTRLVFERPELQVARLPADRACLDADLLSVGDDDVEAAAACHRDVTLAVAREGHLQRRCEWLVEARRQDTLVGGASQLAERLDDGRARGEDECVLDEASVRVFQGQRELRGDDRPDQDRLPGAHREGQDVAGVVEGERLPQGLEAVLAREVVVGADTLMSPSMPFDPSARRRNASPPSPSASRRSAGSS